MNTLSYICVRCNSNKDSQVMQLDWVVKQHNRAACAAAFTYLRLIIMNEFIQLSILRTNVTGANDLCSRTTSTMTIAFCATSCLHTYLLRVCILPNGGFSLQKHSYRSMPLWFFILFKKTDINTLCLDLWYQIFNNSLVENCILNFPFFNGQSSPEKLFFKYNTCIFFHTKYFLSLCGILNDFIFFL